MYRSFLLIDTGANPDRPRPGRFWLRNRYHVHQRLCMAFPSASRHAEDPRFLKPFKRKEFAEGQVHVQRSGEAGFLYHIDPFPHGRAVVIVQSAGKPNWHYAFHNARYLLAAEPVVKQFDPCFSKNQRLKFRLAANPTRRLSENSPDAGAQSVGKRVPVPRDKLVDWLVRRGARGGFAIDQKGTHFQTGYVYMKKEGSSQRLFSVLFDGYLQVTDPVALRQTLIQGIGSGKAFGFGLLLVVPASTAILEGPYENRRPPYFAQVQ